jgi:tetratricopeptide (TPR) repeat protein
MAASSFNNLFSNSSDSAEGNLKKTLWGLGLWTTAGLLSIAIYAVSRLEVGRWYVHSANTALEVFGYGALLGIASMAVGGLFGFLFGIPRTIQSEDKSPSTDYRQAVNTNLEQISDWLTKILVGVGLTQLNNLPTKLWALADRLKPGLNDNQAITTCIVLNFLVCGFFAGYLLTRLFLAGAFSAADRGAGLLIKAAHQKAIETLEIELQGIADNTPKVQKKDIYEKLTYNYLYQDPPDGFSKVIELGKRYVTDEPDTPSPKLWANLALAYGQQYEWESKHGQREDVLESSRKEALQAIQEALKLEPRMLSLFRMVWDPNDPTKVSEEENDLEVFYRDPEFRDILAVKA